MKTAYLDNSATTDVCVEAVKKATETMTIRYGNPSSLHAMGAEAEQEMNTARRQIAALLGCRPDRLVFTSGGTEANNLAILGGAMAKHRAGRHIVTTAVEHASVAASCAELERRGFTVTRLVPGKDGTISPAQAAEACRQDTVLVSIMAVNNETGAYFSPETLFPAIRRAAPSALLHCDGVQAFGKIPFHAEKTDADLVTISAHKMHGPKGCGALYIKKGVRIVPRSFGGGQEGGLRAGTQALPLITAFGAAAAAIPSMERQHRLYGELQEHLHLRLAALQEEYGALWLSPKNAVPYIVSISLPGIPSEVMLHFLAEHGVYVSSGSACSKGKRSPVMTALGLPTRVIDSMLRVSFSYTNTTSDVDCFVDTLEEAAVALTRR